MTTPDVLRSRLAALGLTQAAFARLAGVRPRQGGRWLAGDARTPRWAILLLDLLQLPGAVDRAASAAPGAAPAIAPAPVPPTTLGQALYEQDLLRQPCYHDGSLRKRWHELGPTEKWSWERPLRD